MYLQSYLNFVYFYFLQSEVLLQSEVQSAEKIRMSKKIVDFSIKPYNLIFSVDLKVQISKQVRYHHSLDQSPRESLAYTSAVLSFHHIPICK